MTKEELASTIILSSIPIRELDDNLNPVSFASGVVVKYGGQNYLLTVAHATGNNGKWGIETKYLKGVGQQLFMVGQFSFAKIGNILSGDIKDLDLSYAKIINDIVPYYQELNPDESVEFEAQRLVHITNLGNYPNENSKYGFAGYVKPSLEEHIFSKNKLLFSDGRIVMDMTYIRDEDEYYVFQLADGHLGHINYKGCSGAPILEDSGKLIALVVKGSEEDNLIYGIKISLFKSLLDVDLLE